MKALDKDGLDYVVDKIYDVVNSGGSADYIVEEGTSGIWTYRKWASGISECWGTVSATGSFTGQWGSIYTNDSVTLSADYPSGLFISTPILTLGSEYINGAYWLYAGGAGSKDKTSIIKSGRGTAYQTETIQAYFHAKGLWKTFTPSVMKSATLDTYYPVGSIYISANASFNPNVTFGGTWELMSNNFLVGAGDDYTLGDTGGEATHTLTVDEMPSHKHRLNVGWTSGSKYSVSYTTDKASQWSDAEFTETVGGSQPHNNLPPYKAVNMWLRTA